jgi:hypothetical protein
MIQSAVSQTTSLLVRGTPQPSDKRHDITLTNAPVTSELTGIIGVCMTPGWLRTSSIGRAKAQVVSRRPLTAEARVLARVNSCGICGGQSGTGTGFSPVSIIPPSLSKLISSAEYANVSRHPRLGTRPTPPSGEKSTSLRINYELEQMPGDSRKWIPQVLMLLMVLKGRIMNMVDFWDPTNLTKIRLNHTTEHCFLCPEVWVEPGSSGSIVSDYGLDDRAIEVRSPAGAKDFSSSLCVQTGSGPTQPPAQWVPGVLSPGVKRGRGVTLTAHPHLVPW